MLKRTTEPGVQVVALPVPVQAPPALKLVPVTTIVGGAAVVPTASELGLTEVIVGPATVTGYPTEVPLGLSTVRVSVPAVAKHVWGIVTVIPVVVAAAV